MPALDITPVIKDILVALEPVFARHAEEMKADAEANAPVLTGELKASFRVSKDSETKLNWAGYERWYRRYRVTNRVRYSPFQEEGSVKNTAKRFLRRSFLVNGLAFASDAEKAAVDAVERFNSKV